MNNEGFHVRLASLTDFGETVQNTIDDYTDLIKQLRAADPRASGDGFATLVGLSRLPGSARAHDVCHTMITNYAMLYGNIVQTHEVILAQLGHVAAAVAANHDLYSQLEAKHESVFRGLLDELSDRAAGGDHGATRPE